MLVAGFSRGEQRDRECDQRERDVQVEDRPPAHGFRQDPTDHRADCERHAGDRGPQPDRAGDQVGREVRHDQRQRRGDHQRRAGALNDPPDEQRRVVRGDATAGAGGREHGDTDQEDAPAPEDVAQPSAGREQNREREQVGVHDPLNGRERRVEVALDRRQSDVDDGPVENVHPEPERRRHERPPGCGHRHAPRARRPAPAVARAPRVNGRPVWALAGRGRWRSRGPEDRSLDLPQRRRLNGVGRKDRRGEPHRHPRQPELQLGIGVQPYRARDPPVADVGAVGRPKILDEHPPALDPQTRVAPGHLRVALDGDVGAFPADDHRAHQLDRRAGGRACVDLELEHTGVELACARRSQFRLVERRAEARSTGRDSAWRAGNCASAASRPASRYRSAS